MTETKVYSLGGRKQTQPGILTFPPLFVNYTLCNVNFVVITAFVNKVCGMHPFASQFGLGSSSMKLVRPFFGYQWCCFLWWKLLVQSRGLFYEGGDCDMANWRNRIAQLMEPDWFSNGTRLVQTFSNETGLADEGTGLVQYVPTSRALFF
jgi:hypothetical protein